MTSIAQMEVYSTGRSEEQFLKFNPQYDIQVILIESLFEERNFLRRTMVGLARALGGRGIGAVIADIPGCGESLLALDEVAVADWYEAIARISDHLTAEYGWPPHLASIRGGALLDHTAKAASWWRFAPVSGHDLLRPMRQAQRLGGTDEIERLAGYPISPAMIVDLEAAVPQSPAGPVRESPVAMTGTPLWRLAEPAEDSALVDGLTSDLVEWIRTCAAA